MMKEPADRRTRRLGLLVGGYETMKQEGDDSRGFAGRTHSCMEIGSRASVCSAPAVAHKCKAGGVGNCMHGN